MSWSERYLQKKFPEHTGGTEVPKVPKGGLDTLDTDLPLGRAQKKYAPLGDGPPCPTCGCGSLWRDQSGAWQCEQCTPPGDARVTTWRNFSGGKVPSAPRPAEPWPADLSVLLRRVATAFEWTDQDRRDFAAWARRSPEGLADARRFLEVEAARLPQSGLDARRREVLDRLAAAQEGNDAL